MRTRTEVALYVLNHKRGHLRDLEDGFKVAISISADANQQAFVIDHGEQVHTLEAAKALIAAQAAAAKQPIPEAEDDEDDFIDDELEAADGEEAVGEGAFGQPGETGESEGDARRRKRRRRRRGGRGGEPREQVAADEIGAPALVSEEGDEGDVAGEAEEMAAFDGERADGERSDEAGGRRRRRGRRGGRRRRGGPEHEEGSVAAISDDLGEAPEPEAADAAADLDQPATRHIEISVPDQAPVETPQPAPAPVAIMTQQEADAAAEAAETKRRRSTVREKVSFGTPAAEAPTSQQPDPAPAPAAPEANAAHESASDADQPRRAGWWSRRFGGG